MTEAEEMAIRVSYEDSPAANSVEEGIRYLNGGHYHPAIEALTRAVGIDPDHRFVPALQSTIDEIRGFQESEK